MDNNTINVLSNDFGRSVYGAIDDINIHKEMVQ